MAVYEQKDVLPVARAKLCKAFPDKNLHPVGSGDGKLWINLYDDARLCMFYDTKDMHYQLICPFDAQPLLSKMAEELIPGKSPDTPIQNSLDVIVLPNLDDEQELMTFLFNETQFESIVDCIVNRGKDILKSYFKYWNSQGGRMLTGEELDKIGWVT
jgi:hypothetical protein